MTQDLPKKIEWFVAYPEKYVIDRLNNFEELFDQFKNKVPSYITSNLTYEDWIFEIEHNEFNVYDPKEYKKIKQEMDKFFESLYEKCPETKNWILKH